MMNRRLFSVAVLSILVLGLSAAARGPLRADDKPAAEAAGQGPSKLARDLIGTWVLAGTPDNVEEPPANGGRYKFFTGKHWCVTQADPDSGQIIYHHGGTYTLDGDTYEETILYSTANNAELIKQRFTFKIKVEGDTYTQIGVGNPYNEVWKRAK
jgi:hypothetical protein